MFIILLILGFILLFFGADWLVEGSKDIANRLNIPTIVIGLTLVSLGTSLPEAAVSFTAALKGNSQISISNVLGSDILNLCIIFGAVALFPSIKALPEDIFKSTKRDILTSALAAIILSLFMIFADSQVLPRALGYSLLIMLAAYLLIIYRYSKNNENTEDHELTLVKSLLLILLGIVAVILGGQLVVQNSIILAKILSISDTIIGLTIVALGTSLPELTTSIIAAKKGEHGIAIGNAIGSNIINILLILGVSSIISPLSINVHNIQDAIIFASINIVILLYLLLKKQLKRGLGIALFLTYIAYLAFINIR